MGSKKDRNTYNRDRKLFAVVLFVLLFIVVVLPSAQRLLQPGNETSNSTSKVCFTSTCVDVEIADTPESREKGLMFREHLDEGKGMLFIFEAEGYYGFWMKNTLIPLDMIWINSENEVVHIESAEPCKSVFCASYRTTSPAKYVLEVNSGFAKREGISVGSLATFSGG